MVWAISSLLLATLLWASSFVVFKVAVLIYDPFVIVFGRMTVGVICFLPFMRQFSKPLVKPGSWRYVVFMAICEPCLYFLFESKALQLTTASQAGMIVSLLPLMVAVVARLYLKEPLTRRTMVGFFLAITGAVWLSATAQSTGTAPNPAMGNLLEFLAMICATGYIVSLRQLTVRFNYSPFLLTAIQSLMGSLFYFLLLFLPSTQFPTTFDPRAILAVLYLGAFVNLGAYGLYNFGVSKVPASQAAVYLNLIPVFAIFFGWLFLDETFTPEQYLATLLIFSGIFCSHQGQQTGNTG